ncbi:MAG: type II toxin-antitoxin system VapC family toxin [Acidobacteria bacterium]|nr:type II toxin-antitoxin system VapC family toxin [Acidobacteriota bacterium]
MIVLDASVVVELLTYGPMADAIRRELVSSGESFVVPHLIDIEGARALLTDRRSF